MEPVNQGEPESITSELREYLKDKLGPGDTEHGSDRSICKATLLHIKQLDGARLGWTVAYESLLSAVNELSNAKEIRDRAQAISDQRYGDANFFYALRIAKPE